MKNLRSMQWVALGAVLGGVAAACQATTPSPELVTARRVYDQARQSPAAELDPVSVDEAGSALKAAEAVHLEAPQSARERSHAYIAIRKSELAMSKAHEAAARQAQQQLARAQGAVLGEADAAQARAELDQRERELRAAIVAFAISQAERGAMGEEEGGPTRVTGVFFETGRDELSAVARKQLDIVANELAQSPELDTVIEGFADTSGDAKHNLALSERRADAVRKYLSSRGVDAGRLETVGLGENYPAASNDTATGRAANRRAEVSTGAAEGRPIARTLPPGATDEEPRLEKPGRQPTEDTERQPVRGKDSDFPDDPQPREPDAEPR